MRNSVYFFFRGSCGLDSLYLLFTVLTQIRLIRRRLKSRTTVQADDRDPMNKRK